MWSCGRLKFQRARQGFIGLEGNRKHLHHDCGDAFSALIACPPNFSAFSGLTCATPITGASSSTVRTVPELARRAAGAVNRRPRLGEPFRFADLAGWQRRAMEFWLPEGVARIRCGVELSGLHNHQLTSQAP
jgi:hypothetical protein